MEKIILLNATSVENSKTPKDIFSMKHYFFLFFEANVAIIMMNI